jgi:hypothetical protein
MRRTLALISATAVLGGGALLAAAKPSTLAFTSKTTSQTATFSSHDDVFQGTKKIGTDLIVCTSPGTNSAKCKVTLTVAKGTINGTFTTSQKAKSGPIKVVGGSGAYKGATGTGTYKQLNKNGTKTAVTLNLK